MMRVFFEITQFQTVDVVGEDLTFIIVHERSLTFVLESAYRSEFWEEGRRTSLYIL